MSGHCVGVMHLACTWATFTGDGLSTCTVQRAELTPLGQGAKRRVGNVTSIPKVLYATLASISNPTARPGRASLADESDRNNWQCSARISPSQPANCL